MARPQPVPFVRLSKEVALALRLFGRMNGTEWEVVFTVIAETWGAIPPRKTAEIGMADFRRNSMKAPNAITKALHRLKAWNVLTLVAPGTATTATTWSIQKDWEKWAWDPGALEKAAPMIKVRFPPPDDPTAPLPYTEEAADVGRLLREYITRGNPGAQVPPDAMSNPAWRSWCGEVQSVMDRSEAETHRKATMEGILFYVFDKDTPGADFWATRLAGANAARIFAEKYDEILAFAQRAHKKSQKRRFM